MNPTLRIGMSIVFLALIFYTLFIRQEVRSRKVSNHLLLFLYLGITFDITATVFMILGSLNSPFTLHGFIGYSALAVMLIDTLLMWRLRHRLGENAAIPANLHRYSMFAYAWWVVAFVSGGIIAIVF
jgi:hypothetical protein